MATKSILRLCLSLLSVCSGWRISRPWTEKSWCASVVEPEWPFAYSKFVGQEWERKGRTNIDRQDVRHECSTFGVESKCHRCENDEFQLQGVNIVEMSRNVPTASDAAWAVNGSHRYDFGSNETTHVCVILSGGNCTSPVAKADMRNCASRCWGWQEGRPRPTSTGMDDSREDDVVWEYPKRSTAQGEVATLSGSPRLKGFRDSPNELFNRPSGVAIDSERNVYVVDTDNHAVRVVNRTTRNVWTLAGAEPPNAIAGHRDGPAADARFSFPRGIAVAYEDGDWGNPSKLVLYVADTGNHRIRKISNVALGREFAVVECFAGRCGNGTVSKEATRFEAYPEPGFADGEGMWARFDAPHGLAVHAESGDVVVADTNNHLIRIVNASRFVFTIAGEVVSTLFPGCAPPCLRGVMGVRDGNASTARFQYPKSVSIDEVSTSRNNRTTGRYTIVLTDAERVRRVIPADGWWHSTYEFDGGVLTSGGLVITLAGGIESGQRDGSADEAAFAHPEGVVVAADGHIFVADRETCRIRRVSPPRLVAADLETLRAPTRDACSARLVDVVRPDGCAMYEPPVGSRNLKISAKFGHIHYNHVFQDTGTHQITTMPELSGRTMKTCVGSPPPDHRQKRPWQTGENLVVDDLVYENEEDTGQGTILHFRCPSSCLSLAASAPGTVVGAPPGYFTDESPICPAAVIAGAVNDAVGGFVSVNIVHGKIAQSFSNRTFDYGFENTSIVAPLSTVFGNWPHGALQVERLFSTLAVPESGPFEVQTIAGQATAPLDVPCGFNDGFPPQAAAFDEPTGLALYARSVGSRHNETLVVADSSNHVIRTMTAVCSSPCENGGRCVAPEICSCEWGWGGVDCSTPICEIDSATLLGFPEVLCTNSSMMQPKRTICVAPNTCTCAPGWSSSGCDIPLCAQDKCRNGGACVAPDTCECASGWFDPNCTTPVCAQTCGNGGNCTGPDMCTCPSDWTGNDCREPVCRQMCSNGGSCIAPDTCQCPPQWHGHDCSLPICHQGFFLPFQDAPNVASSIRHQRWPTYRPCYYDLWCNATNGFDCMQDRRVAIPVEIPSGPEWRMITGRSERPIRCDWIEVRKEAITHFSYETEQNGTTRFARYTPLSPYGWNATGHAWRAFSGPRKAGHARTRPWNRASDRQVAMIEWLNVTQGVYVCANGGNCTAPDICRCAPGWIGFDCRTPVCTQGYYEVEQDTFVSGTTDPNEVNAFDRFLDPNMSDHRLRWPYSNPDYVVIEETFAAYDAIVRRNVTKSGVRYLAVDTNGRRSEQGGYRCSIRSLTQWERPGFVFDHVNFFSRHMDSVIQADGNQYTFWENMSWPPTHFKTKKLELLHQLPNGRSVTYVYTNEGHRRKGVWRKSGADWNAGTCVVEFRRVCESASDSQDAASENERSLASAFVEARSTDVTKALRKLGVDVQDTDFAFRARISYDNFRAHGHGRWGDVRIAASSGCVDHVLRGCYNNGTCIAPDTCRCAKGWTGSDCSIPQCSMTCLHRGNCTGPNVCTCEAGWTGIDCSIPICAQECYHGGECVAPDTCKCKQWESEWRTGHEMPRPQFRQPNTGLPQTTGWTGFDCSVPICTQAKQFTPNVGPAADIREEIQNSVSIFESNKATTFPRLGYKELGGRGFDGREDIIDGNGERLLKCDAKPRCPSYDEMVSANVGETYPKGCGFDVLYTGCCVRVLDDVDDDTIREAIEADPTAHREVGNYICRSCDDEQQIISEENKNFTCVGANMLEGAENAVPSVEWTYEELQENGDRYKHGKLRTRDYVKICGPTDMQMNFKEEFYPRPDFDDGSRDEQMTNVTSILFLCGVSQWMQGDYNDDAGLCDDGDCSAASGIGIEYGDGKAMHRFEFGRHIRINSPNITQIRHGFGEEDTWEYGEVVRGEGIYECYNDGTCISPDVCTCTDGWSGFDCKTPLCRHLQSPTGTIAGCENGGVCKYKDTCTCIQAPSVLKVKYDGAPGGMTGWTGTDCAFSFKLRDDPSQNSSGTMPMCVQGYFDPFCTDLPQVRTLLFRIFSISSSQAPGGEGCYRCANGGNCTAPDTCTCAEGWQGYDCRTPVCEIVASPLQRRQLVTMDEYKIDTFEKNPCTMLGTRSSVFYVTSLPSQVFMISSQYLPRTLVKVQAGT